MYKKNRTTICTLFCALTLGAMASPSPALNVEFESIQIDSTGLVIGLEFPDLYAPLHERLLQGLPATIVMECELWKNRSTWFDSRILRNAYLLKMDYDTWNQEFLLRNTEREYRETDTLIVKSLVERQKLTFPWNPPPDSSRVYYLTVQATLKLLTVDDIREVEDWLGGHLKRRKSPLGIPFSLLGILKEASGLGDRTARANSGRFRIEISAEGLYVHRIPASPS
ncbi:MAG: DUF4390 domain-containing protein [Candidatus Eisenbacteria bacterium]|uniref:DUF4390 domain-containing protein n=1 Tax=Eiseniibacteriota bacterium TaxID=2212470 RepID=A0A948RYD2_UNCEI|nr:DUF4390 domain-containing protein [Candidatus Eisenbacteria bacterium]MBU1947307.1 DUF4390 domain-containing protein [Candidatus Eisenbacteria bacterium]MBU2691847.1 DUF4390 domain-containing protein [Candidatus Eisenbacteria bacterium]